MERKETPQRRSDTTRVLASLGVVALLVLIAAASIPFLLHLALANLQQVTDVETVSPQQIPEWVRAKLVTQPNASQLFLLRLKHVSPISTTALLTTTPQARGKLLWIVDETGWKVDWRTIPDLGEPADILAVGRPSTMGGPWERVERICAYGGPTVKPYDRIGKAAYLVSMISLFAGPLLLLYALRLSSKGLRLWHLFTVLWLCLLYLFLFNHFSALDPSYEATSLTYLGYLALILPIIVFEVWRYERSERGRDFLSRVWESRHRFVFERP